jgi:hypothetical protein
MGVTGVQASFARFNLYFRFVPSRLVRHVANLSERIGPVDQHHAENQQPGGGFRTAALFEM